MLASPGSLARLELGESDTFDVITIDVRYCVCYRIRVPQHVAESFALPLLDASLVDSCRGKSEGLVWPCVAALPMGFPGPFGLHNRSIERNFC